MVLLAPPDYIEYFESVKHSIETRGNEYTLLFLIVKSEAGRKTFSFIYFF